MALPPTVAATAPDPRASARAAGLRYVSDATPGFTRRRRGRTFRYLDVSGKPVEDDATLERINALALPPAWTHVWICPNPRGHIQATARDKKGRKQYRYHDRWREVRDETKYGRMLAFVRALPAIRERVAADMARRGLPREKVLATVVRLLEATFIRVGNAEYARQNRSYGLTTLENEHVDVKGGALTFHFRGKSGKSHEIGLRDRRLARIVKQLQDLPGQELFQFVDESDTAHTVESADVNDYLRAISGQDFTAKDFRTWAGTLLATRALVAAEPASSEAKAKRQVARTVAHVAERLGNTPAVCRRCYIHPAVIAAYMDGSLARVAVSPGGEPAAVEEGALAAFLQQRLSEGAASAGAA